MLIKLGHRLSRSHNKLRLVKDNAFKPLVRIFPRWLSPNQVTLFRFVIVLIWLPFAIFKPSWWQIIIFFIVYFFDLLDGALARFKKQITYFGKHFDHFSDRFNHATLYIVIWAVTHYQFVTFKFFVGFEVLAALLIAIEYFLKNTRFSSIRVLFQFCFTIILGLILIYEFIQVYVV